MESSLGTSIDVTVSYLLTHDDTGAGRTCPDIRASDLIGWASLEGSALWHQHFASPITSYDAVTGLVRLPITSSQVAMGGQNILWIIQVLCN